MNNRISRTVAALALSACGGGNEAPMPDGPASLGIVAGNHQIAPAAYDLKLPDPIVAQVVRLPNGQVSLRVLDAVLPEKAYAQTTTVNGIPNQVVCFSAPDPKHAMRAEVPCATSDALGKATFVLHTDTVAGLARGQVAAALATGTKVTDSVSATVLPDVIVTIPRPPLAVDVRVGDSLDIKPLFPFVLDKYNNQITSFLLEWRRYNADTLLIDQTWRTGKVPIRAGDRAVATRVDGRLAYYTVRLNILP